MSDGVDRTLVWVCAIVPAKMGSFERLCIRMAERARLAGVPMRFIFLGEPITEVGDELSAHGATWTVMPGLVDLRAPAAEGLLRWLERTGKCLAHFHYCSGNSAVYTRLATAGHLSVFTYHMSGEAAVSRGLKKSVKQLRRAATTSFIHGFTAVSAWSRRKLAHDYLVPESTIRVIYNGVEVPDQAGSPADTTLHETPHRLLVVAALIREKGVDTAIRALGHVRRRRPEATLTVVGVGPEREALEHLAAEEGLSGAVSWLGVRNDVPQLMRDHDVVLVPSRWGEAFGLTLAEAMAAGRPVIASRGGGIPELIDDGASGLLVEAEDPAAWGGAIERVLGDAVLRDDLGRAGFLTAQKRFNLAGNVGQYWDLYRSLDPWTFSEI